MSKYANANMLAINNCTRAERIQVKGYLFRTNNACNNCQRVTASLPNVDAIVAFIQFTRQKS